jgi:hypothetical protein
MRRMVKENLLKFDGTPLFPERIAYTVPYKLSDAEAQLYKEVTDYVREEFNRAEALQNDKRAGTVGFALTILQRRLASSPEAIYQSLRRRRERLEKRLRELELLQRGGRSRRDPAAAARCSTPTTWRTWRTRRTEVEAAEEEILDQATAARTIAELKAEIETLKRLEALALACAAAARTPSGASWPACSARSSPRPGIGTAWPRAGALRRRPDPAPPVPSPRQKLVIFTEHRDTLNYLETASPRCSAARGGGHDPRRHGPRGAAKAQEAFKHDPEVQVLLATDAAGEGINLQRAHLMVNYDLPWNPNRLEQRFGRIHRIGQTEVCHLWNLVAEETREGDVYRTLLEKLEQARQALGGQVFDVLGKLQFEGKPLRDLLIEAIRYGDQPEVRARLTRWSSTPRPRPLQDLLEERRAGPRRDGRQPRAAHPRGHGARRGPPPAAALHRVVLPRGLQAPGRHARQREPRRYEITHVPAPVRNRDRLIGIGEPVLPRYERIAFEKDADRAAGPAAGRLRLPRPPAARRGHRPDAGAPPRPAASAARCWWTSATRAPQPRVLFYLEHAIQDASLTRAGERASSPSGCSTSSSTPTATRGTCTTRPTSTTGRWPREPGVEDLLAGPSAPGSPRAGAEGAGPRHRHVVPEHLAEVRDRAGADRQDRGGGQGPADQGDHLLGPPRRAAQAPGAGRQAQRPAQLRARPASGPTTAGAAAEAPGELKLEAQISPLPPVVLGGCWSCPPGCSPP